MKSTLKIDFVDNGRGLEPVIKVKVFHTDDTRDSLMKTFFQELRGESSWLRVNFDGSNVIHDDFCQDITLFPVRPAEIPNLINEARTRIDDGLTTDKLPSRYQIGDYCFFSKRPTESESPGYHSGVISGVKFTQGKVKYDITEDMGLGQIHFDVLSEYIHPGPENIPIDIKKAPMSEETFGKLK